MRKRKQECVECGKSFLPRSSYHPNQRYCSKRCVARAWARRNREAHPEKQTLAGGRPSRATKPPRKEGECTACGKIFPNTEEFFQLIRMKRKDKEEVRLSAECRECRKIRFRNFYNTNRKQQIQRATDYAKKFPEKKNARDMARYAATIAPQMPAWSDQRKIETIYAIADFLTEKTGIVYQVDHVYPLKGKTMCGLHTHQNMRVITALANQQKGNRIDPQFDTWSKEN